MRQQPRRAPLWRRVVRAILLGITAIVAVALAAGVPVADKWLFLQGLKDEPVRHRVAPGKAASMYDTEWKVAYANLPDAKNELPEGVQALKLTISVTPRSTTAAKLILREDQLELRDGERTWDATLPTQSIGTPRCRLSVGKTCDYVALAGVPEDVAGRVELSIEPKDYSKETEDIFEAVRKGDTGPSPQLLFART